MRRKNNNRWVVRGKLRQNEEGGGRISANKLKNEQTPERTKSWGKGRIEVGGEKEHGTEEDKFRGLRRK